MPSAAPKSMVISWTLCGADATADDDAKRRDREPPTGSADGATRGRTGPSPLLLAPLPLVRPPGRKRGISATTGGATASPPPGAPPMRRRKSRCPLLGPSPPLPLPLPPPPLDVLGAAERRGWPPRPPGPLGRAVDVAAAAAAATGAGRRCGGSATLHTAMPQVRAVAVWPTERPSGDRVMSGEWSTGCARTLGRQSGLATGAVTCEPQCPDRSSPASLPEKRAPMSQPSASGGPSVSPRT